MKRAKWEQKKVKEVLGFLKNFIGLLTRGRVKIIHFGWWPTAVNGKFRMSMDWETDDK